MEIYENDDAVKTHTSSDHYKTIGAGMGPLLAGRPDIQYFDTI
jgi:quinol monooxygenase YgiN